MDAWLQLRPADPGYTYDVRENKMLPNKRKLQLRLDRAFCKLPGWELESIDRVGMEAIPGKEFEGRPVLPSDHYGLLMKLRWPGQRDRNAS